MRHNEQITNEEYEKYFKRFDPDLYDPKLWARTASQAGMKYFVVTTKHHEGFCLWDSKLTDYKAPNTPAAKGPAAADGRGVPAGESPGRLLPFAH